MNKSNKDVAKKEVKWRNSITELCSLKIFITVSLCLCFFGLGACISIPGPTLISLSENINASISKTSWIFTARSVGYLFGSAIGGALFDCMDQLMILATAMFFSAIPSAIIPWCHELWILSIVIIFQGISMGLLDSGGNVVCIGIWGPKSPSALQTIHFFFGLGAFIAPILSKPFLRSDSPSPPQLSFAKHQPISNSNSLLPQSTVQLTTPMPPTTTSSINMSNYSFPDGMTNCSGLSPYSEFLCRCSIKCPYLAIAIFLTLVGIMIYVLCWYSHYHNSRHSDIIGNDSVQDGSPNYKGYWSSQLVLLFLLALFFFCYVGIEVTYGGLVATFSEREFLVSQQTAAVVTATFWGSFSIARFASIFAAHLMTPMTMIMCDLIITFFATLILISSQFITSEIYKQFFLFLSSISLGLGMSSIFPAGVAWVGSYIQLNGKCASVFVVGSAFGEMVLPIVGAHLMAIKNFYLVYLLLGVTVFCIFLLGAMSFIAHNIAPRENILYRKVDNDTDVSDNNERSDDSDGPSVSMTGILNEGLQTSPSEDNKQIRQ